jgi:hypothetical protein
LKIFFKLKKKGSRLVAATVDVFRCAMLDKMYVDFLEVVHQLFLSAALLGTLTVAQKLQQRRMQPETIRISHQTIWDRKLFRLTITSGKQIVYLAVYVMKGLLDQLARKELAPWAQILCFVVNQILNRSLFSCPFLNNV